MTIYLNGRQVGRTTAGDIYMFDVPDVRIGDTIRVDAAYEGVHGDRFRSGQVQEHEPERADQRVVIRSSGTPSTCCPRRTTSPSAQQQPASQPAAQTPAASTPSGSSTTTSSADANKLTSQIFGNTANQLGNMVSGTNNAYANPTALTAPAENAGNMNINDIQNTINAGGLSGLSF